MKVLIEKKGDLLGETMEDIKQLIKDLFHWNWGVSESARTKLLYLGEQAVPDLIDALWLYQERVTPAIIQGIIILIGKSTVDHLIPWLYKRSPLWHDKDSFMSEKAAEILGEIGDVRALLPLIQNLDSPEDLRYLVVKALEKILEKQEAREYIRQNRNSIIELYGDALMKHLVESDINTTSVVITDILYEIGSLAVPKLMQMIEKEEPTEDDTLEFNSPTLALMNIIWHCASIEEVDKIRIHVRDYVVDKDKDFQIRKAATSLLESINRKKNSLIAVDAEVDKKKIKPPEDKGREGTYRKERVAVR